MNKKEEYIKKEISFTREELDAIHICFIKQYWDHILDKDNIQDIAHAAQLASIVLKAAQMSMDTELLEQAEKLSVQIVINQDEELDSL